jgi:4-hydroxy-3-polyprenylbenzoate decarboxylase
MAYRTFSEFVGALDRGGELIRISEPIATELEITEMADRQMKAPGGGKALLFEKPTIDGKLSQFPVAINTMGSKRRMALAIGLESVDELAHQMQLILKAKPPKSLREGWSLLKLGVDLLHARPTNVSDGPCKEEIHRFGKGADLS